MAIIVSGFLINVLIVRWNIDVDRVMTIEWQKMSHNVEEIGEEEVSLSINLWMHPLWSQLLPRTHTSKLAHLPYGC